MGLAGASGRVVFRRTEEGDLDRVLQIEGDPENASLVRQWTAQQHRDAFSDADYAHVVAVRRSDDRVIGYVILRGLTDADQNVEFKRMVVDVKGEGFGRDTVRLVKEMAFGELRARRLWLEAMEHNTRARRLYASEGFVEEGVHRESVKQGTRRISLVVMSMLKREYDPEGDTEM